MNLKPYIAFAKKSFLNCGAYRADHLMGILNTLIRIFIFWGIYKALYGNHQEVDGITFQMVTTHFVLSLGLDAVFYVNDFYLPRKISNGSIATELLLPISIPGRMLADNLGNAVFRLVFQFLPAAVLSALTIGLAQPASWQMLLLFIMSAILGYGVLWTISFVVQMTSFWLINIWSLATLKNVCINILSGAMIPLWFMPDWMGGLIKWTPFSSVFFTPIQIYLGQLSTSQILEKCGAQVIWILLIYSFGNWLWRMGQKQLVVQGG